MQLPKHYGDSFRKKLDGGGENFNLRIKSLYYYEVGELLCSRIKRIPTSRRGTDNSECRSGERRVKAFKIRVLAANNLLIPPLPSPLPPLPSPNHRASFDQEGGRDPQGGAEEDLCRGEV